ncbi:MAG: glycosyltransferase family 2 protein [Rubrivivax sp.]
MRVAVVIPCFKVKAHILSVLNGIGPEVARIFVVDDACPDASGDFVEHHCRDARVRVLRHANNLGVGGAVMTGYRAALDEGCDILVKLDGDGQMDPRLLPAFLQPILEGQADYTKGNRFFNLEAVETMPRARLIGNAILSFVTKFSSGYWQLFDPTNGYTAIHRDVARYLPFDKISRRYFFETDMLFRLNTLRAVVVDVPMEARYGNEVSNLKIMRILPEFIAKHTRNTFKRIFYNYYLRDMSIASVELPLGIVLLGFGIGFGSYHWLTRSDVVAASAGTVMLSALPILIGVQSLLAFLNYDIASTPNRPFQSRRSHGDGAAATPPEKEAA